MLAPKMLIYISKLRFLWVIRFAHERLRLSTQALNLSFSPLSLEFSCRYYLKSFTVILFFSAIVVFENLVIKKKYTFVNAVLTFKNVFLKSANYHIEKKLALLGLINFIAIIVLFTISVPRKLFTDPVSTIVEDFDSYLLGAHIADDGQWRFPPMENVPDKFREAIISFEDKRYFSHFGIDPVAMGRALYSNIMSMERVSGGSTLTMQVIRLSRKGQDRTIFEKFIEMAMAVRLEMSYSKDEILALYASNAPFGGNVIGLDAAAWRYFGRKPNDLSWAEAAMLAILPNSPALIHPGRNREILLNKRNRLLLKLYDEGKINQEDYELAIEEPIPDKPRPFPSYAPHLLSDFMIRNSNKDEENRKYKLHSTIKLEFQRKVDEIVNRHAAGYAGNGINNAAAIVIEVETGNVIAYVGNVNMPGDKVHGTQVDVLRSPRSTGSILKPLLYCSMLSSGEILPNALVPDIPTHISGYTPKNYNLGYDGAVPARRALARSLNIPAIKLLQDYGTQKFLYMLRKLGMTTVTKTVDYYGLSLILGGCEGKLFELAGIYASMARVLKHYRKNQSRYDEGDFHPAFVNFEDYLKDSERTENLQNSSLLSASAIYLTFKAMLDVERPPEQSGWENFKSNQKIAWKTGTSFGFRDGWAIGVTPDYVVGVWIGNADGEGRPKLTGITTAAPVLFDIFSYLPQAQSWFDIPYDDMAYEAICHQSGHLASELCEDVDSVWIPAAGIRFTKCPYHKIVHLDETEKFQVHSECEETQNMVHKPWFVLPPAVEWFYKSKNANYKVLPPFRSDCLVEMENAGKNSMEVIYPKNLTKIYVPVELDGTAGKTIFEVAHRKEEALIFWHVDDEFVGQTQRYHQLALNPPPGKHVLTLVDEDGNELTVKFEIINQEKKQK